MSTANTLQNIFDDIYREDRWKGGSGPGSNIATTTEYVSYLNDLLRSLNVKSFLDVGCGDWQLGARIDFTGIRYKGIDVSKNAVIAAKSKAPEGTDISNQQINEINESFDFVHIKDVLQHLPLIECDKILGYASKNKYVLVVNDHCEKNLDIEAGQHRPLNVLFWPNSKLLRMFKIGESIKSAILITNIK
jgi:SAM-dependent methyltransferase